MVTMVAVGAVVRVTNESWTVREELLLDRRASLMKLPEVEYEAPTTVAEATDLLAVARALDAQFVVRGPSGERVIPAAQWFEGYLTTARRPDELLVEVRFPAAGPDTGASFEEVARRHGDFAIVGLATSLVLSDG